MSPLSLLQVIIGAVIVAIGASALAVALLRRLRPDRSAFWFGMFVLLYGVRLIARAEPVQSVFATPAGLWDGLDAALTYLIGLPGALFLRSLFSDGGSRLLQWTVYIFATYAVAGIIADLVTGQPYSAHRLNAPIVTFGILVASYYFMSRGRWFHPETKWALAAVGAFLGAVTVNTLAEPVDGADVIEGVAMLGVVVALGYVVATKALETERRMTSLSRELELASRIQRSILPAMRPSVPGLDVAAGYKPVDDVAGDVYDWTVLPDGRLAVLVADVSGHGVPAALVASMVKVAFASATEHARDPGEILSRLNRTLHGKFAQAYVTATCAVVDGASGSLRYANAGHPPPLVRRARDERLDALDAGGIALAFMPDVGYTAGETVLRPGDLAILFSDGLTEAANATGEFFGDAEFATSLRAVRTDDADAALTDLFSRFSRWSGSEAPPEDDVTVVTLVKCAPIPRSAGG